MKIVELSVENLRIFSKKTFVFEKNLVVFCGENASGKTTILEAIYLLSTTKSPRTNDLLELVKQGKDFLLVEGTVNRLKEGCKLFISASKEGKRIKKDGATYRKISQYLGSFDVIFYQPLDVLFFLDSPQNRRRFFDSVFSQISNRYLGVLSSYKRTLKQRNFALKEAFFVKNKNNIILVETLTKQLEEFGKELIQLRKTYIEKLDCVISKIHHHFASNEKLNILYKPNVDKDYSKTIEENLNYDVSTQCTNFGPHKDDYTLTINSENIISFCSQGQQKSAILSCKISLLELFKKEKGEYPVLILDDAFGELDQNRQNALLKMVDSSIQVFISTTSLNEIDQKIIDNSQVIEIKKGDGFDG